MVHTTVVGSVDFWLTDLTPKSLNFIGVRVIRAPHRPRPLAWMGELVAWDFFQDCRSAADAARSNSRRQLPVLVRDADLSRRILSGRLPGHFRLVFPFVGQLPASTLPVRSYDRIAPRGRRKKLYAGAEIANEGPLGEGTFCFWQSTVILFDNPVFLDVPRVNDAGLPLRANTHSATYFTKMSRGKPSKFPGLFARHG